MELIKDINKVTYEDFYDEERLFALLCFIIMNLLNMVQLGKF